MRKLAYSSLVVSIFIIICSIILLITPISFYDLNNNFSPIMNIVSILSMSFSIIALLIASLAFIASTAKPKLSIRITPFRTDYIEPTLHVERETGCVPIYVPNTRFLISIENNGDSVARYPMVQLKFGGIYFGPEDFSGWVKNFHEHSLGYYGMQWAGNESILIYPGFPKELPSLDFTGFYIGEESESNGYINMEISYVADNFNKKCFNFKFKLIYV